MSPELVSQRKVSSKNCSSEYFGNPMNARLSSNQEVMTGVNLVSLSAGVEPEEIALQLGNMEFLAEWMLDQAKSCSVSLKEVEWISCWSRSMNSPVSLICGLQLAYLPNVDMGKVSKASENFTKALSWILHARYAYHNLGHYKLQSPPTPGKAVHFSTASSNERQHENREGVRALFCFSTRK